MSRLGGPRPASEDKDSAKSKAAKKEDNADDDAGGPKQPGKGLGTRGSAGNLLPPLELVQSERGACLQSDQG